MIVWATKTLCALRSHLPRRVDVHKVPQRSPHVSIFRPIVLQTPLKTYQIALFQQKRVRRVTFNLHAPASRLDVVIHTDAVSSIQVFHLVQPQADDQHHTTALQPVRAIASSHCTAHGLNFSE